MAQVFLGVDHGAGASTPRPVVIKRLREHLSRDADALRRFLNEGELHARVKHPNVVAIHDIGRDERGLFIALEWVDGASLHALLHRAKELGVALDPRVGTRIVLDALRGLHAAHLARDDKGRPLGILHRDATPHNILVGRDGRSCLTDFGVAKARGGRNLTEPGMVVGKLDYLSPEYLSRQPVDVTMDIYSMGVTAWITLTGRRPFGDSERVSADMLTRRVPDVHPSAGVSPAVASVVHRACSHDPRDRFRSAEAMADALESAAIASDALASQAEVAARVRAILHANAPRTLPPKETTKAWDKLGVDEDVWRSEAPTSRDATIGFYEYVASGR